MNKTKAPTRRLEAGESFSVTGHPHTLVAVEGELLVQRGAQWLAGTVVWPAPQQVAAPAVLVLEAGATVTARGAAHFALQRHMTAFDRAWALALRWLRPLAYKPEGQSPPAARRRTPTWAG